MKFFENKRSHLFILFAMFVSSGLWGCGSMTQLNSNPLDRDIVVDGDYTEWGGQMWALDQENIYIGTLNDDAFLYLSIVASDRQTGMKMVMQGFTLWFDPDGGTDKVLGIRFPLGVGDEKKGPPSRPGEMSEPDSEQIKEQFESSLTELEIFTKGNELPNRLLVADAHGVDVSASVESRSFVYELKIPLHRDETHPYGIGTKSGKLLSLKLETPEIDVKEIRDKRDAMPGGGRGGRGGGGGGIPGDRRGGGPGGGSNMRPQASQPIDLWIKIQLASMDDIIR